MKHSLCAAVLVVAAGPALAADVGVSLTVDKPGFYGSIDIGNTRPRTVNVEPIVVQPAVNVVAPAPLYMHVPPGHAKQWARFCHQYNACGRPVYFVQDDWYENTYLPEQRGRGGDHPGGGPGNGKGHGNHGKGHGKGHGQGHK